MVAVAIVGVVFYAALTTVRFVRNPYYGQPYWIRAMRRHEAELHGRKAEISTGERAAFHRATQDKWKRAALSPRSDVEPAPPEPK